MSNFTCFLCLTKLSSFATGSEDYKRKYQTLIINNQRKQISQKVITPVIKFLAPITPKRKENKNKQKKKKKQSGRV